MAAYLSRPVWGSAGVPAPGRYDQGGEDAAYYPAEVRAQARAAGLGEVAMVGMLPLGALSWTDEQKNIAAFLLNLNNESNPPVYIGGALFLRLGADPGDDEIAPAFKRRAEAAAALRASGQIYYSDKWGWVVLRDAYASIITPYRNKVGVFEKVLSNLPLIAAAAFTAGAASGALSPYVATEAAAAPASAASAAPGAAAGAAPAGGSPLMFSAEQAAQEGIAAYAAGPQLALPPPAMFSAEAAAADALPGAFISAGTSSSAAASGLPLLTTWAVPAKTLVGIGQAARSLLGGSGPSSGPVPVGSSPPPPAGADLVWTAATLAAAFLLFKFARG